MTVASWIAFLVYALVAIGLGWRAAQAHDAGADYWTAGRSLNAGAVGVSISAGFMSVSWSCVYAVQLFYWYGVGALWLITVPWLLALGGIYWLSQRYHDLDAFSQPEMVGHRFGAPARRVVAIALAFVFLVWGGAEIYVAATLLAPGMGVTTTTLILLISLIVAVYATLGGFRAVVSTDKLQYGIVAAYILAMGWLAMRGLRSSSLWLDAGPGAGSAWTALWQAPVMGARTNRPWMELLDPGLATIVLTFVAYLPGWLFETDLWLRVQAARDTRAARRGVTIAAVNSALFVGLLPLFIGMAALVIYPLQAGEFPPEIGIEGDAIFAALVRDFAPAWLALLVSIGLVAAAMSTIDTCANVMALSIGYDLLRIHQRAPADAARWSRGVTLAAVGAACLFALNTESLWDIFYLSSGVLTTAVAFPVAAVFLPWARPRAVTWSATAGLVGTVAAYFLESRSLLTAIEPTVLADSGLGYIFWGCLAATLGYGLGRIAPADPASEAG